MTDDKRLKELEEVPLTKAARAEAEGSYLGNWYLAIRNKKLSELSLDDLGIAIRQSVFLPWVVPLALIEIKKDFLAGAGYDGQLVAAFAAIPASFWKEHHELAQKVQEIWSNAPCELDDPELRQDIVSVLGAVQQATRT